MHTLKSNLTGTDRFQWHWIGDGTDNEDNNDEQCK